MQTGLFFYFLGFFIIGIFFNFFLFSRERKGTGENKFITSERLIVFLVEILIAVVGFGITLNITDYNEKRIEKDTAIQMLEQTIEYTSNEIETESQYLVMFKEEVMDARVFLNSSVININYYNTILSNELILRNVDMSTYGYCMDYLVRIEDCMEQAKAATDDSTLYSEMYWRCQYLKKLRDLITVYHQELSDEITAEEAIAKCKDIDDKDISTYE